MIIVLEEGMNVKSLQTKYPIIDWEVYTEDSRMYWKIIRVRNHTEVELKRLFKPDDDDSLWKLQRYMHDPLKWRLYDTRDVHHVSTERGHDIFILVKKNYPLTRALITLMLSNKLQVDEYSGGDDGDEERVVVSAVGGNHGGGGVEAAGMKVVLWGCEMAMMMMRWLSFDGDEVMVEMMWWMWW
ncbi:hypothetical protein Tco_1052861 [Tanacetum coccineum]